MNSHFRMTSNPVVPTAEELQPGRNAGYAMLERKLALMACGVMVAAGLIALASRWIFAGWEVKASQRLPALLRLSDVGWILALGGVLPVVIYLGISRFSPFAAREWSWSFVGPEPFAGKFGSGVVLMLMAMVAATHWWLKRRGSEVGLDFGGAWSAMAAAAGALGVMVWAGTAWAREFPQGLLAMVLLPLVGWIVCLVKRPETRLPRRVLVRCMVPFCLAGAAMFSGMIFFFHAEERHWTKLDRLTVVSPESEGSFAWESRVAEALRAELLEFRAGMRR